MALRIISIIHLVAVVFSIIELGLIAYVVSVFSHPWVETPSQMSFMLFNAIWTLLVLAYIGLTPLYYARLFHQLAALALETVTMIFWFAGSIALAAYIGSPYYCAANTWCGSIQAAVAFGFFLWALFVALVVLDAREVLRSRNHGTASHSHAKPYVGA